MPISRLILHFGTDALLSEARAQVLEDAGYEVLTVDTHNAALRVLRTRAVLAVIVCHSVPPDELEAALAMIKNLKPHVPIMVVHVGGLVRPHRSLADGFVDGLRGPEHLLSQVAAFITRSKATAAAS
jgi:DNA-binding response OmpR family regulator